MVVVALAVPSSRAAAEPDQSCTGNKPGRYDVKIDSAPHGAVIRIGGKACEPTGVTPWAGKLDDRDYTVHLQAQGYQDAVRTLQVKKERKQQLLFVPLVKKRDTPN
jgi:hypothetical protein